MHEGKMDTVKLILDDPGIVGFPVIRDGGVLGSFGDIVEEFRDIGQRQSVSIPYPDKTMGFVHGPRFYLEIGGNEGLSSVCRYHSALAGGIILQPMEWALNLISVTDFPQRERRAAVTALIGETDEETTRSPVENYFFSKPGHAHGPLRFGDVGRGEAERRAGVVFDLV